MGGGYYTDQAFEQAQDSAAALLAETAAIGNERGRAVTTTVEIGQPATTVIGYAEASAFDHVIRGSHGRRGLSRFRLGSVEEAVAGRSPVSVTIIRISTE